MPSEHYHEPLEKLTPSTIDLHRALVSLAEELDAIDWYQQRVDATSDPELKAILAHNRDEEKEHASMVLEWIRRHDPAFCRALKSYAFTEGDVTRIEEQEKAEGAQPGQGAGKGQAPALTVGSLKGR